MFRFSDPPHTPRAPFRTKSYPASHVFNSRNQDMGNYCSNE
ncbi:hypothetical protein BFJ70_g6975 [Fusarium oxysporum]|uniref:Uncharacterized protein n=1 Tax=Fusarium oxysporum TaxID=5507 RepID=A0A420T7B0_FUSOX|nr:hypothetical protein BFJ69_g405 [Fusarium oxysporum]RKK98712.1 hypothetical protein BFJ68_g13482 [Fusarium oxysporum]RKL37402.1 hypothetical protein BFJ70_g6975 [Fusarium oxysporum]